jgi:hypothetical protein
VFAQGTLALRLDPPSYGGVRGVGPIGAAKRWVDVAAIGTTHGEVVVAEGRIDQSLEHPLRQKRDQWGLRTDLRGLWWRLPQGPKCLPVGDADAAQICRYLLRVDPDAHK